MVTVGALEAIRTGTTTWSRTPAASAVRPPRWRRPDCDGCSPNRSATARSAGPMSPEGLAKSETPKFSARLRDEGMQRISDLFALARREAGAHQRVSRRGARRNVVARTAEGDPRVRGETRPRLHHPPVAERRGGRFHDAASWPASAGVSRQAWLPRSSLVRGALPLCRRCRHRAAGQIAHDRVASGRDGGQPRRHPANPRAARGRLPHRQRHRQQHQRSVRGDAGRAADRTHPRNDAYPGVRPQPEDMLEDATQGGARAVHQRKLIGSLEIGRKPTCSSWTPCARISFRPGASCPRGFTTVSRPTSSRDGRRAVHHAQPQGTDDGRGQHRRAKPTRSDGGSGARCSKAVRSRCQGGRNSADTARTSHYAVQLSVSSRSFSTS